MDWTLEVVVLPVRDIDRSIAFYRDKVCFHLDHDTQNEHMADEPIERVRAAFSENFGRLQALKSRYDPDNVLHRNQNIPPQ